MNLATHPFENRRQFYVVSGAACILLSLAGIVLAVTVIRDFRNERGLSRQINTLSTELTKLDAEQKRLDEFLQRPNVVDVMDRSEFINALIQQKAISWTRIFMDLEKLMPERVQVVSIRPVLMEAEKSGIRSFTQRKPKSRTVLGLGGPLEMDLQMSVSSDKFNELLELVRRMEHSGNFHEPVLRQETQPGGSNTADNLIQLQLNVFYAQK